MTEAESNTASEPRDERVVTFGGAQMAGAAAGDGAAENAARDATGSSQAEPGAPSETTPSSKRRALRCGAIIGAAAIVAAVAVGVALANGGAFQPAADDASVPSVSQQASEGSKAAEPSTTATSESAEPADEQPESEATATSEAASPAAPAEGSDAAAAVTQGGSMGAPSSNAQSSAGDTGGAGGASSPSAPSSPGSSGGASAGSEGGTASNGQQQGSPQTPPAEEPAVQTVTVQVDSSAVGGSVSFDGTVEYREGMTVFDVLVETGLPYNAESSAFGIYVSAIGGLAEKDGGSQSGWKYSVNGEVVMVSASACTVQPGDVVKWFYTTVG